MAVDGKYESYAEDGTVDGYIEYVNNRSVLTSDYAELENPGSEGIPDARFVDYLVREFVLRLQKV